MSTTIESAALARRRNRLFAAAGASVVAGAGVLFMGLNTASADPASVTLCHATASTTHPYQEITVAPNAIQNLIFGPNGHGSHTGPVFDPNGGKNQPAWGDIIPAFSYGDPVINYPGMNLADGQAILDAGCLVPGEPTETVTDTASASDTASAAPTGETNVPPVVVTVTPATVAEAPTGAAAPIPVAAEAGRHTVSRASLALGTALIAAGGAGFVMAARRRSSH